MTLYSYLEHQLNTISRCIGKETQSRIKLSDFGGRGISRALSYLKRVPEFKFDNIGDQISFIRNSNKLRNCIVHNGGILPDNNDDDVNQFVASEATLQGDPGSLVTISEEFVSAFSGAIRALFDEIGNEMQRWMDRNWRD